MKTERALLTEEQVAELVREAVDKAIKQDREFQAQVLRALPVLSADVRRLFSRNS